MNTYRNLFGYTYLLLVNSNRVAEENPEKFLSSLSILKK